MRNAVLAAAVFAALAAPASAGGLSPDVPGGHPSLGSGSGRWSLCPRAPGKTGLSLFLPAQAQQPRHPERLLARAVAQASPHGVNFRLCEEPRSGDEANQGSAHGLLRASSKHCRR